MRDETLTSCPEARRLVKLVTGLRRRLLFNELLFASGHLLGILLLVSLLIALGHLPGWYTLSAAVPILIVLRPAIRRIRRLFSLYKVAELIQSAFPQLEMGLVPALELARELTAAKTAGVHLGTWLGAMKRRQSIMERPTAIWGYSQQLVRAAIGDTWTRLETLPTKRLENWQRMLTGIIVLMLAVALIAIASHFMPERLQSGLYLSFVPNRFPVTLSVEPGDCQVNRGDSISLRIQAISRFSLNKATISIMGSTSNLLTVPLVPAVGGEQQNRERLWDGSIRLHVRSEFDYQVQCYTRKTPIYHIGLREPLNITSLTFECVPPAYTRLPRNKTQHREIAVLPGSRIIVRGETDRELTCAELKFRHASHEAESTMTSVIMNSNGKSFVGEFTVRQAADFEIQLQDRNGNVNPPEVFRVSMIQDEYPLVHIFAPGGNLSLPSSMKVVLGINSVDDYGLTKLALCYVRDSVVQTIPIKSLGNRLEDTTYYLWDLSQLDILPGTSVRYYATVLDNDVVSGPKLSQSETYTVRFPTLSELYQQATEKTAAVESLMVPLSRQQELLYEQTQRIDDALKRNRQLSWEEQQTLKSVVVNQDSILAAIRNLREDVRRALDDMFQGVVVDSGALQGLRQLDTLLSQVLPKQLLEALDSLRSALEKNPQQLKMAMQRFRYTQEDMAKAIQRAVELLRRLRHEQEMSNLVRKAEELLREQTRIQQNPNRESETQLALRQEMIREGIDSLQERLLSLSRELPESEWAKELQKLAERMESDSLRPLAQSAAKDYQQGKTAHARQKGDKLRQSLQALSSQLNELQKKMHQRHSQELTDRLLQTARDLLVVSDAQEQIGQQIPGIPDLSPLVVSEKRLGDALRIIAETLATLSMRSMQVPPQLTEPVVRAMSSIDELAEALEANSAGRVDRGLLAVTTNLNQAVRDILRCLEQAQQGGGFGGGMESLLQQLSQALSGQMQLSQEMGGMLPLPMPGGMSGEMLEQWQQLLARQQVLREALERLLESYGGQQPGMSGSIQAAIEEMKQLERDMATLNPQRPYLERHERIVNKLLDAQRSVRRREYTEKRESEPGREFRPPVSPQLPADYGERDKFLREQLIRALKDEFPREYESYVRAYFDALLQE